MISETFSCLLTPDHPLKDVIESSSSSQVFVVDTETSIDLKSLDLQGHLVDLCLFATRKKRQHLSNLSTLGIPFISDLSINWAERFHREFKNLSLSTSLSFYSPQKKCEFFVSDEKMSAPFEHFLKNIGFRGMAVHHPGIGFHYPRTVAMLINEGHFLLEEGGLKREDIDRAMIYGASYPLGPFEWAEKIGPANVLSLLDELYEVTGNPRYRACPLLRLEAL